MGGPRVLNELRPELPTLPRRISQLHVRRGYPVPWFVTWLDNDVPVPAGEGQPDFRIITPERVRDAVVGRRCWVCGGRMGAHMSFVIGPMCAVNRTSAEPPSHFECGEWSARACPFLTRPHMRRNEGTPLPEGAGDHPPGIMLRRNPGVTMLWTTRGYSTIRDGRGGMLFRIGDPEHVRWYREGRPATRDEVYESLRTGIPALEELAAQDGDDALRELERAVERAVELFPA